MRTAGVKRLIERALQSLPLPHNEDVIDDVFFAIEKNPEWRQDYEDLCLELTKNVVNTWGGFWIANHEGRSGDQQVPSKKSTLIGAFSKLTGPATKKFGVKVKEADARQLMSDYYHAHKSELPERIKRGREMIIDLLMEGFPVEDAFSTVLENLE
jgi:hypothetical protein